MRSDSGLERAVDSITVGTRARTDLGDLTALADSMADLGQLQPITITPDGVLLCGYRRLTAAKALGWNTIKVFVRSGISSDLKRLMAELDENRVRKDFTPLELATLYAEMKAVIAEDARANQLAGLKQNDGARLDDSSRRIGDSRVQAARAVTGNSGFQSPERVLEVRRLADDVSLPDGLRAVAREQLAAMEATGRVSGPYALAKRAQALSVLETVRASEETPPEVRDEIDATIAVIQTTTGNEKLARAAAKALQLAEEELSGARRKKAKRPGPSATLVRRPPEEPTRWVTRAFVDMLARNDFWWLHYNPAEVGSQLRPDQWALVEDHLANLAEFVEAAREYRRG